MTIGLSINGLAFNKRFASTTAKDGSSPSSSTTDETSRADGSAFCSQSYNNGTSTTESSSATAGGGSDSNLSPERRYWLKTLLNAASTKFLNQTQKDSEMEGIHPEKAAATIVASQSTVVGDPQKVGLEEKIQNVLKSTPTPATSVSDLLQYNKTWSETIRKIDPTYFTDLAKQQTPKFLWIGCADSRVPANQILGLAPGEVFVHRNIANVVSRSDLNCLSVVQFGVEHLRVEQLLVVGHYGCGGVTAAYKGLRLGLVDNWVSNISDIKYRNQAALERVPEEVRVDLLCELNAITQALNVAESNVVQAHWKAFREEQEKAANDSSTANTNAQQQSTTSNKQPLDVHGWCYGLADGLVHPLVDFGPYDDVRAKAAEAIEAAVNSRAGGKAARQPLVSKKLN